MPRDSQAATLSDNAITTIETLGDGAFSLPKNATLLHVSLNISSASQGPVRGGCAIRYPGTLSYQVLKPPKWIRSDEDYGYRESWTWTGEIDIERTGETLLIILLRNDSGVEITWSVDWVWRNRR